MQLRATAQHSRGFTLVELMVVVVIATILVAVAVPSYMSQMRQTRRTEAKTSLLDLAGREERYFSTSANGANYSATSTDLGYTGSWPLPVGSGYYKITVCSPANANCVAGLNMPNPPAAPSYTIVAAPVATQSQVNDTQCGTYAVDSVGQQYATGTGGSAYCWGN